MTEFEYEIYTSGFVGFNLRYGKPGKPKRWAMRLRKGAYEQSNNPSDWVLLNFLTKQHAKRWLQVDPVKEKPVEVGTVYKND